MDAITFMFSLLCDIFQEDDISRTISVNMFSLSADDTLAPVFLLFKLKKKTLLPLTN